MALSGIKVLEFVGLAPGPFCGKLLADFGATVTRIDKVYDNPLDVLIHGKRTLAVDLKNVKGQELVRRLSSHYDVLIDPFRPGVMEKLNLGPKVLCKDHPRLIYARLTGFGQNGILSQRAGHDINYVAISGILSMLGQKGQKPVPPINILADFAGGGLLCAFGICLALLERHRSNRGQVVDAAMSEGSAYVASWLLMSRKLPIWSEEDSGNNLLDGGSYYYDTYETKDGKYMSVGAIETQFYEKFKEVLDLPDLSDYSVDGAKSFIQNAFLQKTQNEWSQIFENTDACVFPVVEWQQVHQHKHNKGRDSFQIDNDGIIIPTPAPRLDRTPGKINKTTKKIDAIEEARLILKDLKIGGNEFDKLISDEVLVISTSSKL